MMTRRELRSTYTDQHTLSLVEEHERYYVYLSEERPGPGAELGVLIGDGTSDTAAIMSAEERLHKLWRRTQELRRR